MGHHKNAATIRSQIFFQPFQHPHIQVIGWFIQKQKIRMTNKCSRQIDSHFLSSGESMNISVPVRVRKAKSGQYLSCRGFIIITSQIFKPFFGPSICCHQFLIVTGFQLPCQFCQFILVVKHVFPCQFHFFTKCLALIIEVLPEITDNGSRAGGNRALIIILLPHKTTKKSGLTGSVGPYQAYAFSASHFE